MTHIIKVTNKNSFEIRDYYQGYAYNFTPEEPVNVPLDAMKHIFGVDFPADDQLLKSRDFRDQIFTKVSRRWGWNAHDAKKLAENRRCLDNIAFTPVMMKEVEVVVDNSSALASARDPKPIRKDAKFKSRADEAGDASEEEVA